MRTRALLLTTILLTSALAAGRATAQDAPAPVTIAAGGLVNPRGFTWDVSGAMLVAEAGTGGDTAPTAEVPPPTGPYRGGPTARVSRIEAGCPVTVADGLPSAVSAAGETLGVADVALVGGRLLALVAGGGAAHGNPDSPAGIYELKDGEAALVVDLSDHLRSVPAVSEPPTVDADPDGALYSMVAKPTGDGVWIAERNSGQVLLVGLVDPFVARLADLSADHAMPTALAVDADGSLYVGMFSSAPYAAGSAYVLKVGAAADTTPLAAPERVWTGLTMVTGLAVGPDGALYATEFSSARDQPPFFVAATGRVLRQTGPDTSQEVLTQLNFPTATRFGPDGALYVSLPGVGADDGTGVVVRADLSGSLPIPAGSYDLTAAACAPGDVEGAIRVSIYDFGFDPSVLTVTVGATVTWVNEGAVDHTTVAFAGGGTTWDSDLLAPGDEYSHTFDEVGAFAYVCGLYPDMHGTIDVVPTGP